MVYFHHFSFLGRFPEKPPEKPGEFAEITVFYGRPDDLLIFAGQTALFWISERHFQGL
jgi:hypothetical protein